MGVISVSESAAIRRRQRIACVLIVIGLLLLAAAPRLSRLEQLPPGLFIDEAANGMDALGVLQGQHALFFPEITGREGMVIYATALAIAALGRTIMAVRLPAALWPASERCWRFSGWARCFSLNGAPMARRRPGAACSSAARPRACSQFRSAPPSSAAIASGLSCRCFWR